MNITVKKSFFQWAKFVSPVNEENFHPYKSLQSASPDWKLNPKKLNFHIFDSSEKKILKINNLAELLKKKIFSLFWFSFNAISRNNNPKEINNKQLIKRTLEVWETYTCHSDDEVISAFYHWRGIIKVENVYRLKEFKHLFNS